MLQKLFNWLQGRTTAYIIGFFVMGNILQWVHKLDQTYIMFMGTLLGAAIGHSFKDDKHEQAMKDKDGGDNAGK
jgi:hypothetical protein